MPETLNRPYIKWSVEEIGSHVWALRDDTDELAIVIDELRLRHTDKSQALLRRLEQMLRTATERRSTSAHKAAADPVTIGFMAAAIAKLREKLIDISKRNQLISFRHSERGATYVRIVDELPDELFGRLNGGSMTFDALPNPDQEPADQKTAEFKLSMETARLTDPEYLSALDRLGDRAQDEGAVQEIERELIARVREALGLPRLAIGNKLDIAAFARANGFDPSFSLAKEGERRGSHLDDGAIRVLYTRDRLEARLRKIYDRYRGHAAETGIHTLQLAFGFVEWQEPDGLRESHLSPLLLMPVRLERELRAQRYVYSLSGEDENLVVNMALQELLLRQHGIVLPAAAEDDTPESYFGKVQPILPEDRGLKLERFVTLAVLPFPNMAVWRDLDPECWPESSILAHEQVGLLMGATGGSAGSGAFPQDYPVEDLPQREVPPLVLAADVSQHSALIDVSSRRSLALEGPPGTGKSQTIANMIAGALSQNLRVLFVAEKRAALDVVARRLDELGFGPVMLELHSERATKARVLEDLRERIEFRGYSDPAKINAVHEDLTFRRDLLKRYRAMLHRTYGSLSKPVNWLVWREMSLRARLEGVIPKSVWSRDVAGAKEIDAFGLQRRREALSNLEQTAKAIAAAYGSLEACRWHAVKTLPATPFAQDQALARLGEAGQAFDELIRVRNDLAATVGADLPDTMDGLAGLVLRCEALPDARGSDANRLSAAFRDLTVVVTLRDLLSKRDQLLRRLEPVHPDPLSASVELIEAAEKSIVEASYPSASLEVLHGACAETEDDLKRLRALEPFVQLVKQAGLDSATALALQTFAEALASLADLGDETLALRSAELLADDAVSRLRRAAQEAEALRNRASGLMAAADIAMATRIGAAALDATAATLEDANVLLRLFSPKYKQAVRLTRSVATKRLKPPAAVETLRLLSGFLRDAEGFDRQVEYEALFAKHWRGYVSDFERATELADQLARADLAFRSCRLPSPLAWLVAEPARALRVGADQARSLAAQRACFERIAEEGEPLADTIARRNDKLSALRRAVAAVGACGIVSDADLDGRAQAISQSISELQRLQSETLDAAELFGAPWFQGPDEDPIRLTAVIDLATTAAGVSLPEPLVEALRRSVDPVELLHKLSEGGLTLSARLGAVHTAWSTFAEAHSVGASYFFGVRSMEAEPLEELSAAIAEALRDERGMKLISDLLRYLEIAKSEDTRWVFDALSLQHAEMTNLAEVYELALIRTLLQEVLRTDAAGIERLGGAQLAEASNKFVDADKTLAELEAARIVMERLRDEVPEGKGYGPKSTYSDMNLIHNEISKKRRHVPIRDLVTRAHAALQRLKPVWLMSPTSVAQFVPPGTASFDLVIIDEASQMTPEMAVGALGRGAQVVVVGDPKQLPPSNWFKTRSDGGDNDDDDDGFEIESESILDLAFSRLNARRRLKWHYRSQHSSLIQFSNRQFYDKALVIFPSPITDDDLLGVKSYFVGGTYEGRVNVDEARAVIEALVGLIYTRPELTFGVATMNVEQRELIFQEFERMKSEDKVIREYAERHEGTIDELFIKNLENVQGDERDVILISTLYGPPPGGGRPMQRFGIFVRKDGHRRLNVLVTRARMATLVFTSLRPADIIVSETSSEGVQAFRAYLGYAEGAPTAESDAGGAPDSDFEEFVAERLRAHGYEVVPQVGVEGFRIDLGIKHEAFPSGFLAGVECDGATYHSHLSVRDRDRIRQDVLQRLGWNIYRVWSTDWFNDPAKETGRLVAWLDGLRDRAAAALTRSSKVETAALGVSPAPVAASPEAPKSPDLPDEPTPPAPARGAVTSSVEVEPPEFAAETPDTAPPRRAPTGKRHVVGEIEFYEPMPGFFEVWVDGVDIGSVERVSTVVETARVYGGAFRAPKPSFVATRGWNESTFAADDIYAAVRRLVKEHGESFGSSGRDQDSNRQ